MPTVPTLLRERLRALRAERGLSRSDLSFATVRLGYAGVPEPTIEALETKPGRIPDAEIIEALAAALEIDPDEFYEYPVAVARRRSRAATAPARGERTPGAADGLPRPPGELGRRVEGSQPSEQRQPRRRSRRAPGGRS